MNGFPRTFTWEQVNEKTCKDGCTRVWGGEKALYDLWRDHMKGSMSKRVAIEYHLEEVGG